VHPARDWNIFLRMTNCFGVPLHPEDVRWAAAEGVSETVIATVLLLHERRVDEVVPKLSAVELEQVIKLVGRSPSVYPPGTLDALKQHRTSISLQPPGDSGASDQAAKEPVGLTPGTKRPWRRETPLPPGHSAGGHSPRSIKTGANGIKTGANGVKAGTYVGTRNETARRRLIVEDLMKAGLSIRMISEVSDIPRSSVHRAMCAIARAEAKKEVAINEIAAELLGKKLSHRGRGRA
jgi:hypothetical protein